jgi:hypothetical protein
MVHESRNVTTMDDEIFLESFEWCNDCTECCHLQGYGSQLIDQACNPFPIYPIRKFLYPSGDKLDEVCSASFTPGVDFCQHLCVHNPKVGYVN